MKKRKINIFSSFETKKGKKVLKDMEFKNFFLKPFPKTYTFTSPCIIDPKDHPDDYRNN